MNHRNYHAFIETETLRVTSNFKFNVDLASSSIVSLSTNDNIYEYLTTGSGNISEIRTALTEKTNSIYFLLGLSIYPTNSTYSPIASTNISGLVSTENMLLQPRIKEFLKSENDTLLFIRNDCVNASYYFNHFDASEGMCSLVNKLYKDNKFIGLAISDFHTGKLYNQMLNFKDDPKFNSATYYLYDGDVGLVNEKEIDYLEKSKVSNKLSTYSLATNAIKCHLGDNVYIMMSMPKISTSFYVIIISVLSGGFGLAFCIVAYFVCRKMTKAIIEPLESLAKRMGETSE